MATLLPNANVTSHQLKGYRVFIFSHDHPHPPHVHFGRKKRFSRWDIQQLICTDPMAFQNPNSRRNGNYCYNTLMKSSRAGRSTGSAKIPEHRAKALRFDDGRLIIAFRDGREMHVPLRLYPTLTRATPSQRSNWIMIGPGKAFHWPELDLDLSVDGLVQGLREAIPAPPRVKTRRSA